MKNIKQRETFECFYCKQDCTDEYYAWAHESLKLVNDAAIKNGRMIICPNCYNVPLEPHGTFGNNMIARGEGRIEKHRGIKVEVIREDKNALRYDFNTSELLERLKAAGGIRHENMGKTLKAVHDDLQKAVKEKRYEEAARFREREVELANRIMKMLEQDK